MKRIKGKIIQEIKSEVKDNKVIPEINNAIKDEVMRQIKKTINDKKEIQKIKNEIEKEIKVYERK